MLDTEYDIGHFLMSTGVALDEEYRIGHVMMCLSHKVSFANRNLVQG
jgi:hypothetical protein